MSPSAWRVDVVRARPVNPASVSGRKNVLPLAGVRSKISWWPSGQTTVTVCGVVER